MIILTILKLIFGAIFAVFKVICKAITILRLWGVAVYLVICGVLQLGWHWFDGENQKYLFWTLLVLVTLLTLLSFVFTWTKKRK